jgi:hypothetical protein
MAFKEEDGSGNSFRYNDKKHANVTTRSIHRVHVVPLQKAQADGL